MLFENVDQILQPGHLPMETGYCRLANGQMYVTVLTRMPGCKAKWIDWWFKTRVIRNEDKAKLKNSLSSIQLPQGKLKLDFKAEHQGKYVMDKELSNVRLELIDPADIFDISRLDREGMRIILCGNNYFLDGSPAGHIIYIVRNTEYGCEMRSHFWMNNATEERARTRMEHCLEDMGELADYLKTIILKIKQLTNKPDVTCKFCFSDEVIKNGVRKSGQYWSCKSCGHHFIDNKALPRMRYPVEAITKAVEKHSYGNSLSSICTDIEEELNVTPSYSAVYEWKKKLTKIALTE